MEEEVSGEIKREEEISGESEKDGLNGEVGKDGAAAAAPAAAADEKPETAEGGLTDEEKRLVRNYAVNDPEVRRAIISDYVKRLRAGDNVPEVMQGGAGASPVFVPRAARDMREAAVLAEALLKRK